MSDLLETMMRVDAMYHSIKEKQKKQETKRLIIWFMFFSIIDWSLLMCAWLKTIQHQTDPALIYIIIFLVVNIINYRVVIRIFPKND